MAKVDWKTDKPKKDGVYLTTLKMSEQAWAVLTRLEDGEWQTAGEVTAWDYRPEPYEPENDEQEDGKCHDDYCSNYVEDLEWKIKDLEATWSEVHGEMKYYEGAAEALLDVIKLII